MNNDVLRHYKRNVVYAKMVKRPSIAVVHRGAFELMPWPACREGIPTNCWAHADLPVTCPKCAAE